MAIFYYSDGVAIPPFRRRVVNKWIEAVAESYGYEVGEITFQFCNDVRILEVNNKYLGHNYYTDVITFGQEVDEDLLFADIIISLDTVASNATQYGEPFERELLRVLIHGVLHLCGCDDQSDEEQQAMRAAEEKALRLLPEDLSEVWRKGTLE